MSAHHLDVEAFISEVKRFPQLWDVNSEDYRYTKRKQRAWAEIARVFITNFDDLPASEKFNNYKRLNDKWRNIRDSFVKFRKQCNKKTYMYAAQLAFLNDIYKPGSQSESEDPWNDERPKYRTIKKEKRHFNLLNDTWHVDDSNLDLKRLKPDDIEFVDSFPDVTCNNTSYSEDEDKSFFDSLLPAVREFSLDQKLDFRGEIINLIKKIRADIKYNIDVQQ